MFSNRYVMLLNKRISKTSLKNKNKKFRFKNKSQLELGDKWCAEEPQRWGLRGRSLASARSRGLGRRDTFMTSSMYPPVSSSSCIISFHDITNISSRDGSHHILLWRHHNFFCDIINISICDVIIISIYDVICIFF